MNQILAPLKRHTRLADTPARDPEFFTTVKMAGGGTVKVADPYATRPPVGLMDMNAVMGGAASHWGGPSAFAELMSATHGIMFAHARKSGQPWHELFNFANDGGHCENGLYALKANYGFAGMNFEELKGFRSV